MITRRKLLLRSALAAPAIILSSRKLLHARPMHGKPSGGGGYVAKAVHADGSAYLSTAALSVPDSGLLSYSGWRNFTDLSELKYLWNLDPNNNVNDFHVNSNLLVFLQLAKTDFSSYAGWNSDPGLITPGWHHFLLSADMNQSSGNKVTAFYLDDLQVPVSLVEGGTHAAFEMSWAPNLSFLGATYNNLIGDAADEWFAPGVSLLSGSTIPEATRRLFISATGKPVNPSGFPASAVLFQRTTNDPLSFGNNHGSGSDFIWTGTPTNATTSPSD